MKNLETFEQYSIGRGLESIPYSQIDEVMKYIKLDYPIFHKTPFLRNVTNILKNGIKRIPNKFLHLFGFGGNPKLVKIKNKMKSGISFTNSFELVKSKWKGDITFIFDKKEIIQRYGDIFFTVEGGGESEELLLDVEIISPKLIKGILFSDNITFNEIEKLKIKNIIILHQLKDNSIIKL